MSLGVLDVPAEWAAGLADRLRAAGFAVEVECGPHPEFVEVTVTRVRCRRGIDVQAVGWAPLPSDPARCRVWFAAAGGWWPPTRRRRCQLLSDVLAALDRGGGWPFPD